MFWIAVRSQCTALIRVRLDVILPGGHLHRWSIQLFLRLYIEIGPSTEQTASQEDIAKRLDAMQKALGAA